MCHLRDTLPTVVALYFETEKYAPFVVTNPQGGYIEFSMPWRDGTRLRAARREDLVLRELGSPLSGDVSIKI